MSVATAILRKCLGSLMVALTFVATVKYAYADARHCIITNEPGPAGELSLGCVIKADAVTIYIRNPGKPPAAEDAAVVARFPNGFDKEILRVGQGITAYHTLMVEELLRIDGRQVLRGYLVDPRGCALHGPIYSYPQEWNCSLHVNPNH